MYEKFFNFSEKPFNTTPDSKFFFPSSKHQEALNSLLYAIQERKGFVVITGEIGSGKTTISRSLLNKINLNTKVALITNTNLTPKELIAAILEELDVDYREGTKQKLLSQLNAHLIKQLAADVNVVLIVDEAQNLSTKVLEEIRMLSNLETEKEKLIQIILLGQPELRIKLNNAKLDQFRQRIAVYYHLNPLNKQETREYIFHRLSLVNSNGYQQIFTSEAMDLVYTNSKGIPRLVNLVCDSALLSGFIYGNKVITEKIVSEVIKERDVTSPWIDSAEVSVEDSDKGTKIVCCSKCAHYTRCELKWVRGMRNQEQLCCNSCSSYLECLAKNETSGVAHC